IQEAAREAERRLGIRFWTRIGVHATRDTDVESVTIVALALKGHARLDTIMISGGVRRHVRGEFLVLPLAPASLLPDLPPEPTFEVIGRKIAKKAADRAPFVGRQTEGRQMLDLMKLTFQLGPQIVDLVAEAGVGKTRVAHEFSQRVAQRGLGRVLRGNAVSDVVGTPQELVASLLRSWLGVGTISLPEEIALRLNSEVTALGVAAPGRTVALLAHLLGVDVPDPDLMALTPFQRRAAAYRAFNESLVHMARQAFLLLVLDDLQWADDASLAWLHSLLQMLEGMPDLPILFLLAYRPEADRDFGEGFGPARWRVTLEGLGKREARRLAAGLLGQEGGLETIAEPAARHLLETAVDRAAGNPLHLSEIIQALVDRGALVRDETGWHRGAHLEALPVPSSFQEAVADRLEQLDEVTLRTLQAASVLGRTFPPALLARLLCVEDALGILAELVLQDMLVPEPTGEYSFNQATSLDLIYRAIPPERRQALHRQAATALEEFQTPSRQRNPVPVARHYLLSDEPHLAVPYLVGAGERALAANAPGEAIAAFSRALELLAEDSGDVSRYDVLLALCEAQAADGRYTDAIRNLEAVLAMPAANGRSAPPGDPLVYARLADVHRRAGDSGAALAAYQRGIASVDATLFPEARGLLRVGLAELESQAGDIERAAESAREAQALLKATEHPDEASRAQVILGRCAVAAGRADEGLEAFRRAISLRHHLRDHLGASVVLVELGQVLRVQGDWTEARNVLDQAIILARTVGDRRHGARAQLALAELSLDEGEIEACDLLMQAAYESFLEGSDLAMMGLTRLRLGEACLIAGDVGQAETCVEEGLAIAHALGDALLRGSLHRLAAQVARRRGQLYRPHLEAAELMADNSGDPALREEVYRCVAELAQADGDLATAKAYANRASQLADERLRPLAAGRTLAVWSRIYAAEGETDLEVDFDARAAGIFSRLGARRDLALLES
ncbi:MAG: AAA family ATPase, partial [Candidatus Sericytochromatia bacterium]|nr:AAA family ATPase [Candidatus Tanganyikabacteria bacterium]